MPAASEHGHKVRDAVDTIRHRVHHSLWVSGRTDSRLMVSRSGLRDAPPLGRWLRDILVPMDVTSEPVGCRVVVTGIAGAGKSTFSRALSARTGLPLIHLDLEYWKPGWTRPSEDEWRRKQRGLLEGDTWIADGNYPETLDLRLDLADTVVVLDTPWWVCAARAFRRGVRRPAGTVMPDGCVDSVSQRVRDEWRCAGLACWNRGSEPARERRIVSEVGRHVAVRRLRSKREAAAFLEMCGRR